MSQLSDDELKKLVESNARAIEALANTVAENERQSKKEMAEFRETVANAIQNLSHAVAHLDNSLARVAISQSDIASNTCRMINRLENRNILVDRGVSSQDIVIAYHPPYFRQYTEFAVS